MIIEVSREIYDRLNSYLKGWIWRDITDKNLIPEIQCERDNRMHSDDVSIAVWKIMRTKYGDFLSVYGMGIPVDEATSLRPSKYLYNDMIFLQRDDFYICGEFYEYYKYKLKCGDLSMLFVYRTVDRRLIISYIETDHYPHITSQVLQRDLAGIYRNRKCVRLIEYLVKKYNLDVKQKDPYIKMWEEVKAKYRVLKQLCYSHMDRLLNAGSVSVQALRDAGWRHYEIVQSQEPEHMNQTDNFIGSFIAVKDAQLDGYTLIQDKNGKVIGVVRTADISMDTNPICFELTDSRVVQCLEYYPGCIDISLDKIKYYKWAVERIQDAILQTKVKKRHG